MPRYLTFPNGFLVVTPVLDKPKNERIGKMGESADSGKNVAYPLDCRFSPMALKLRFPDRTLCQPGRCRRISAVESCRKSTNGDRTKTGLRQACRRCLGVAPGSLHGVGHGRLAATGDGSNRSEAKRIGGRPAEFLGR